jgi:phosphoribosyl-dephospho-CoA transferase
LTSSQFRHILLAMKRVKLSPRDAKLPKRACLLCDKRFQPKNRMHDYCSEKHRIMAYWERELKKLSRGAA